MTANKKRSEIEGLENKTNHTGKIAVEELEEAGNDDSMEKQEETNQEEETPSVSIDELSEKLEIITSEKNEINDRLLRTMAEFDNYKKRVNKEKENLVNYGIEKLAFELLPVLDNFERALLQAREVSDIESVVEGIEMILKQLTDTMEKFHVKPFESVGKPFNPEKHEAMAQQEHDCYDDNTVIEEFHKGYSLKDKLLRPARVIVSREPLEKGKSEN